MIDINRKNNPAKSTGLSQIEINTFACGGVADSSNMVKFYK